MDSLLDIVARVKRACLPPRAEIGSVSLASHPGRQTRQRPMHHQARELDGAALIHRAAPLGHGIRPGAASRSYLRHLGRTLKVRPRRPRYDRASLRASARARPSGAAGAAGGRSVRVLVRGAERERTFATPTYLSPILLTSTPRRMGERYVHVTNFR